MIYRTLHFNVMFTAKTFLNCHGNSDHTAEQLQAPVHGHRFSLISLKPVDLLPPQCNL